MGVSHLASLIIQARMNEYLNQNRGAGNKEDGRNGNFSRICFLRKRGKAEIFKVMPLVGKEKTEEQQTCVWRADKTDVN